MGTKHLIVYVVEKDGYDPIHTAKLDGDFYNQKCLVRRPLGWSATTTDLTPERTIDSFFAANMNISELAAMTEAAAEIAQTLEAEADKALERLDLIRTSLSRRLDKIRERHQPHTPESV